MKKLNLLKQQKILLCLFEMSNGKRTNLKFEDIAVALYKKFPKDFHLKGYEEYPDSGDSIKRPLYTFRDKGILSVRNMTFSLTDKGLDIAEKTQSIIEGKKVNQGENFDRYIEKEIKRIQNLNSFSLYLENTFDNILDTDFFDYLGISVRSSRMEFKSRLSFLDDIAKLLIKQKRPLYKKIYDFHNFMRKKFDSEINYKLNN